MDNGQSIQHQNAVKNLALFFQNSRKYQLLGVDHPDYSQKPPVLPNNGVGDKQNKQADVYAFDPALQRYVNGEVKLGPEVSAEHSITQFKLFSNLVNTANKVPSLLVIAIPKNYQPQLVQNLNQFGINTDNIEIVNY